MNKNILIGSAWILGTFGVIALCYLIFGFMAWLFSDPLNLIPDEVPFSHAENLDVIKCRELGGFPVKSGWDGSLKECKKLELK